MVEKLPFGERMGALKTPIPGPRSRDFARRLSAVESPGITYVTSEFPIFWERAFGANVKDVDDNIFVDLTSAFGVAALGHADPTVIAALEAQSKRLPHGMGDVHPPAVKVELLEKLTSLFPAPGAQAILCTSGAEAVEAALKTAYLISGRPGVLSFQDGYHGLTYGTLSVSGQVRFYEPFHPQLPHFGFRASFPRGHGDRNREVTETSLKELEEILTKAEARKTPIGAVLLEPIQGRGGVRIPPQGWLKAVRDFTHRHRLVLIVDEILTGFGRTGTFFAVERENIVPDLLCVGKALTGCLPFSACIGTPEIMNGWPPSTGEALHTSTFLGHPLGCVAALATISKIREKDLPQRAERLGREALDILRPWEKWVPMVKEVRGRGFLIGIQLERNGEKGLAFEATKRALQKGVIVLPAGSDGNVLSLTPPLTIGWRQFEWSLQILRDVLDSLT